MLVPRRTFFREPDRSSVQLSSDGQQLAWRQPVDGILNVFVAPAGDLTHARQITHETDRSIAGYLWAYTNRHLVILRDPDGSENHHSYSVDIDTGHERALIEQAGVRSFIWRASRDHPAEMLFGVNARDRRYFDVVRVDVTTGKSRVVFENPGYSGCLHLMRPLGVTFNSATAQNNRGKTQLHLASHSLIIRPCSQERKLPRDVFGTSS